MKVDRTGATLNSRVFEALRADVLNGTLAPNQRLKIASLAATQGVSLNVIREALNRLAGEGLIDVEPQLGFSVRGLSVEDLQDLVEQRIVFESMALRRCIERSCVDWQSQVLAAHHRLHKTPLKIAGRLNPLWMERHDDFHTELLKGCGSPHLFQMIRQMAESAEIYQRALLPIASREKEMQIEHQEMLSAVLADDGDRAVRVLTLHLEKTRDDMLGVLRKSGESAAVAVVGPR